MLVIVAHHYVVNSGLIQVVEESAEFSTKNIFLLLFGWGGKTGINCFVLITGYFMCTSHITAKKFLKLVGTWYFYKIAIYFIFLITGYSSFGLKAFIKMLFPFTSVQQNFTTCFVLFYLFIPFLNKLIQVMTELEHRTLLLLCLGVYTILPSITAHVTFNYVTWFCILFILASYIRLYPQKWFNNTKLWGTLTFAALIVSWLSIICIYYIGPLIGRTDLYYFFVSDSNKILALTTAVCAFMFFKNLNIKQSRVINTIAASTFAVLLIHAASNTMRQWLWRDTFKNVTMYQSPWLVIHAVSTVFVVYTVCTVIDIVRVQIMGVCKRFLKL